MTLALLGAATAAICYGAGSVLQAVAARRTAAAHHLDVRGLARVVGQGTYLAGMALDLVGFGASVLALRTLPLFLVQSAVASSVGVTALLAIAFLGARLQRSETLALAGLGAGLVLLALAAEPEHATPLHHAGPWVLLAGTAAVLGVGLVGVRRGAAWLAVGAGLAFAGTGISARVLAVPHPAWRLAVDPVALSLAGYGVLGTLLFAAALQRGAITATVAVTVAVETMLPAVVGLTLLGDHARPGYSWAAVSGFAVAVASAAALGRYAEPPVGEESGSAQDFAGPATNRAG